MSHALNRIPPCAGLAVRSSFGGSAVTRSRAGPSGNAAAARRVLDDVLDSCSSSQDTMRSGARVVVVCDDRFDAAATLYRQGRWAPAFDGLATLADQGHAPAAKLALLMLRYGAPLYGATFAAKPTQVARWAQRVLRATWRATASPSSITASA